MHNLAWEFEKFYRGTPHSVFLTCKQDENFLGRVAHFINPIAWKGLNVFHEMLGEEGQVPHNLAVLADPIQTSDVNSVLTQLLKLITWIYKLAQHLQSFLKQFGFYLGYVINVVPNVEHDGIWP